MKSMNSPKTLRNALVLILVCAALLVPVALLAQESATIHYHRPRGDYEGWALHVWEGAANPTEWTAPLAPTGTDDFGIYWEVPLAAGAAELNFIIHAGEVKDPGPDQVLDLSVSTQAWVVSNVATVFTEEIDPLDTVTQDEPTAEPPAPAATAEPAEEALRVGFPGNFGQAIGSPSWTPDDAAIQGNDEDGDGVYTLTVMLPRGDYEFKVALNGAWDENYGLGGEADGENIPFSVPEQSEVVFSFTPESGSIGVTVGGEEVVLDGMPVGVGEETVATPGDGMIAENAILHDSRSDLYRAPGGAQPLGTEVSLRLRTLSSDVESVRLLVDDLLNGVSSAQPMTLVADDRTFQYWQTTFATGGTPTVFNYKFEIVDGGTTLFYGDDGDLTGGAGAVSAERPFIWNGWDLYAYVPGFESPAWAHNAIIYQILPDRFRNGDPTNDTPADAFGYPEERGQVFPITPWNTIVPDPDPQDAAANPDWYATWNSTFYGGDLQGVREKLDYLQEMGVNTIYFTPVHEAATNHRYDARDFRLVDDNLAIVDDFVASMAYFTEFAAEVEARGMHLILDAVPNHTGSDSPYFDRYGNWEMVGACESVESEYRERYLFEPAPDPANAPCADGQNYRGFAGISTLPQQDTASEDVMEDWLGPEGIANYWLNIPGVDGWRVDTVADVVGVNPTFFQPWRVVTKEAHPDSLLISETWRESDVRAHVLGNEFDSTMNYRFANALLGFLRDSVWEDTNDGAIQPLTASEFEATLRAIEEDYPPAAFAAAMNLLSSHDINRAVRVLDHDGVDYSTLQPVNGFADGRERLALAAVLQFTLPGAPTVFYGDEIGLVGFGLDRTRDDPHNRQPYPWEDAEGFDDLPEWRKPDSDLLAHYTALGTLRAAHSYLRTGAWDTLLVDDTGLYVYARKDATGAAIIAVNRGDEAIETTLDLTGYLPFGAELTNAFTDDALAVGDDGALTFTVDAMDFGIWLTADEITLDAPAAPQVEGVAGSGVVTLTVSGAEDASAVLIYRSPVDGGFLRVARLGAGPAITYVDNSVNNGERYYYRAVAVGADGLYSAPSASIALLPTAQFESVSLLEPLAVEHVLSAITPTVQLNALLVMPDIADDAPPPALVEAGYAPADAADDPAAWQWSAAHFNTIAEDGYQYAARLLPEAAGEYLYAFRFSADQGETWLQTESGTLTVLPNEDTDAPNPPFRMDEIARSAQQISFAWRLSRPRDLAFFRVCRTDLTAQEPECATEFTVEKATNVYTDTNVITGHTYVYTVRVVDNAFNFSEPSAPLTLTAELTIAQVTFRVLVPPETPADAQIYIAGSDAAIFGAAFDPARIPMTNVGEGIWEWSTEALDGQIFQYKYTRGTWEQVEQWGAITGFGNRSVQIARASDGTMLVDDTATDWGAEGADDHRAIQTWRDPLVTETLPAPDASGSVESVQVTFSVAASASDPNAVITVVDAAGAPVSGTVAQESSRVYRFTPDAPLAAGSYTATAFNVEASTPMIEPYVWSFTVE